MRSKKKTKFMKPFSWSIIPLNAVFLALTVTNKSHSLRNNKETDKTCGVRFFLTPHPSRDFFSLSHRLTLKQGKKNFSSHLRIEW